MTNVANDRHFFPALEPDVAIPPGETIRDLLEELGMTQAELARRTGLSPKHINQLLHGVVPLTAETAQKLELAIGTPARIWMRLEADFQAVASRLEQEREFAADAAWLSELPVRELVRRNVLPEEPKDRPSRVRQLLAFFGVASPTAWREVWFDPAAAYRQSKAFDINAGAVATWLRMGEVKGRAIETALFRRETLRVALPDLRTLTRESVEVFEPALKHACAECGIALVFVSDIPGARMSGATRWLSPTKVLIQLSLRYKTDDQLWFTFFHEVGHVLLHSKSEIWIDSFKQKEDRFEEEANDFARNLLIPVEYSPALQQLTGLSDIRRFADDIGVAPGIVIGRLQWQGLLKHGVGEHLKQRFELVESG